MTNKQTKKKIKHTPATHSHTDENTGTNREEGEKQYAVKEQEEMQVEVFQIIYYTLKKEAN